MNNAILVPTDFSLNSKAGMRFAIQLSRQGKNPLVFYHCVPVMKPTRWSEATYQAYVARETDSARETLSSLIQGVYKGLGVKPSRFETVIQHDADVQKAILRYAASAGMGAICMSTRGAGRLKKIIGTNTSAIIHHADIPVFVVPSNYRTQPLRRVLYASDLDSVGPELKLVRKLAEQLKVGITVCHYDYLAHLDETQKKFNKVAQRYAAPGVDFVLGKFNIDKSLATHLTADMRKQKASLAVLFTNQKRGWFDRLFNASRTEAVAFDAKFPLLVFPRK